MQTYFSSPIEQRNFIDKDAALCGIGTISKFLVKSKKYKPMVEPMLVQHVVPEFDNPHGFMRSRAMWMFQKFSDLSYANPDHLRLVTRRVIQVIGLWFRPYILQALTAHLVWLGCTVSSGSRSPRPDPSSEDAQILGQQRRSGSCSRGIVLF